MIQGPPSSRGKSPDPCARGATQRARHAADERYVPPCARASIRTKYSPYINADIILGDDFMPAVQQPQRRPTDRFLHDRQTNRRQHFRADRFRAPRWTEELSELAQREGSPAPRVCKDYFVFRKPLLAEIPEFAIGRAVHDNWFVYDVKRQAFPVVDATNWCGPFNQNHGYGHVAGGNRGQAYVRGEESRINKQHAGELRLVAGSTTTQSPHAAGLRRRFIPSDWPQLFSATCRAFFASFWNSKVGASRRLPEPSAARKAAS